MRMAHGLRPETEELRLPSRKQGAHFEDGKISSRGEVVGATNVGGGVAAKHELGDSGGTDEEVVGEGQSGSGFHGFENFLFEPTVTEPLPSRAAEVNGNVSVALCCKAE
jgi:hypothetical protein